MMCSFGDRSSTKALLPRGKLGPSVRFKKAYGPPRVQRKGVRPLISGVEEAVCRSQTTVQGLWCDPDWT